MLVACRLAGLSALETYYARVRVGAQFGARGPQSCGLVLRADGPDGLVPRLFRMRGEMVAHPLLKIHGNVDRHGVESRQFGF